MMKHSVPQSRNLDVPSSEEGVSGDELLRHLLIGSTDGVTSTIQTLHCLGYAEPGDWSPLLPVADSGEVMSILIRNIFCG